MKSETAQRKKRTVLFWRQGNHHAAIAAQIVLPAWQPER
jgi:hypothetical protein